MSEKNRPAYVVGQYPYCYRQGIPALVIGLKMVTPGDELQERPCLHIKFADGKEDFISLSKVGTDEKAVWRLLSPDEIMLKWKGPSDKHLE